MLLSSNKTISLQKLNRLGENAKEEALQIFVGSRALRPRGPSPPPGMLGEGAAPCGKARGASVRASARGRLLGRGRAQARRASGPRIPAPGPRGCCGGAETRTAAPLQPRVRGLDRCLLPGDGRRISRRLRRIAKNASSSHEPYLREEAGIEAESLLFNLSGRAGAQAARAETHIGRGCRGRGARNWGPPDVPRPSFPAAALRPGSDVQRRLCPAGLRVAARGEAPDASTSPGLPE